MTHWPAEFLHGILNMVVNTFYLFIERRHMFEMELESVYE